MAERAADNREVGGENPPLPSTPGPPEPVYSLLPYAVGESGFCSGLENPREDNVEKQQEKRLIGALLNWLNGEPMSQEELRRTLAELKEELRDPISVEEYQKQNRYPSLAYLWEPHIGPKGQVTIQFREQGELKTVCEIQAKDLWDSHRAETIRKLAFAAEIPQSVACDILWLA